MADTTHEFEVTTLNGEKQSLSEHKGKHVLIVNVASACGFTKQYEGLQKLHTQFDGKGFAVLGFPCNQFGQQEPGTAEEIKTFCSTKFGVTFPMFAKIDVNGENAAPLYQYLTGGTEIKWNFEKFLIDGDGKIVKRYPSDATPDSIAPDIESALA